MEDLQQYLARPGITLTSVARDLGINVSSVHKWATNKTRPSDTMKVRLAEVTGGAVPVSAWFKSEAA